MQIADTVQTELHALRGDINISVIVKVDTMFTALKEIFGARNIILILSTHLHTFIYIYCLLNPSHVLSMRY